MKTFQITNPTLTITTPSSQASGLIQSQLRIKFKINQTQLLSQSTSKFSEEYKIEWTQILTLQGIPEGENKVEVDIVNGQDVCMSFEGELVVQESTQEIMSEWKNCEVVIRFELHQFREERKSEEKVEGEKVVQNRERMDREEQDVGHADDQGGQDSDQSDSSVEIERQVKNMRFDERRKRQTEQELKLADMFTKEKEKARILSRELLKRISAKAQKRAEIKKSDRNQRKKQTIKESKLSTDRKNKENLHRQKVDKSAFDLQDDDRFFNSGSPQMGSQSLSRSQLRDEIKMFRSKFGDRIYENQNSTTMQRSVLCFSMPKGPRFKYSKYNGVEPSYYVGTSFSSKSKGTSFGYGTRKPYPQWMVRNMHENPAPNVYTVNQPPVQPSSSSKGFSFGISYKYYEKTSIVGTECSSKSTTRGGMLPKLSKPSTSNTPRTPILDTTKGHYHYRGRM